jgi:cytochrome c556
MRLTRPTLFATLAMGAASMAATPATDAIRARQETMESIGDAIGRLAAIAKKEAPFDAAVVEKSAGTIAKGFETAATLFPPGSGEGDVEVPSVTVKTEDGRTMSFKIADKKNLEGVKVGDKVDITYTTALTISIK